VDERWGLLDDAAGNGVAHLVLGDVLVDFCGDELLHAELDLAFQRVDGEDLRLDDLTGAEHIRGVVEAAIRGDLADVDQAFNTIGELNEGAEIHRRARVVAPAYIGGGSKVRADALITRFSNIERDCCIDCGTAVEDSSVLANTSVGIWLDLCHAVVRENMLLNLERDVLIEILDSRVLRASGASRRFAPKTSERREVLEQISDLQETRQVLNAWQLGNNNLIQE